MKKLWPITTILCLLTVVGCTVYVLWSCIVPLGKTSEVYRRYAQRDDLKVGFVKDYRINDTVNVNVTTITAPDSASWEALLREMNVSEDVIALEREAMNAGKKSASTYYSAKGHPEERVLIKKVPEFDLVVLSFKELTIYSFDVESIEKSRIIQMHKCSEYI